MSNWKKLTLGDVASWCSGGTPSRKHPEYYGGDIPWIKTGELKSKFLYDTEEKITLEGLRCPSAKKIPVHTVVIAMYGATIGQASITEIEATTNQACACAVAKENVTYEFLYYYILSQKDELVRLG